MSLRLSEVGRQFHQFPKGSFKACFAPPPCVLLKCMLSHFASHPPTWSWTIKAGPNKHKLHFHGSPPFCLAVCTDRSLHTISSIHIAHGRLSTFIKLPPDPPVPMAQP
ncbi:hypothetical protein PISMIDRAFT_20276 [Pisolithus microcarpus 441]|uniref:Uncharacterized protein n=1 Tax=Pisolithus microcarpus 441 TaxID=765257 RepID=A0A0C9Y997_9AGAM|nr:hypothetical protein PISMIDRAFT_20387 [Pisolithus microcarpus 441]KIK10564.1 hypothetical protein PISMIDRAFT_20276 [Pisolithus microcarpus 441]